MCLIEAQICVADSSFSFLRLPHKSPYRFGDPSCAFGAALLQGPTQLARWTFSHHMRQFLNAFPLREGGGQRPGWMCLIEAQICVADSSFSFLRLPHKSPYRFGDPSCAFGAALLQGPTQLARWTFSHHMRQFLNAFPLREGGGQRPGWMCLIEAQICVADSSFSFLRLPHKSPYRFGDPSCAFGAAFLQGLTREGLSDIGFPTADGLLFAFSFSEVFVGAPEAFFEGDFGLPLEIAFRFGIVQGGTVDVALSGFIVGGGDLFPRDFGENGYQFFQTGFLGSAEVVGGIGRFGRERIKDAVCDITGVDEVAGLISIAENGDALPFSHAFRKDADDAAFPAVALPFAVDIGKAENDIVYAVSETVKLEIILGRLFGEAVKGKRLLRQGLGNRERVIGHISIGRCRGGEDDTLDAVFPAALEDTDRAGDVLMHVVLGIGHGVGDEGLRREVNDGVEMLFPENVFDSFVMGIHDDELHMREQVLAKTGGEIVQRDGFVACCFECPHQVGTDESGSAGNKYFHV